jgi:tetratricopeptide (TPR) repeat protein
VLATSRLQLRLAAEHEVPVGPLEPPAAEALFVERASAVDPAFEADEAVGEICRRLDCLPLAIELAAARSDLLTPAALLERLERSALDVGRGPRDAPARQQTLRATILWSEELLSRESARLFASLGVFRGGWTVDAAEGVANASLETLASLVGHGLARRDGSRMTMLETVAEVARERFASLPDGEAMRERHGWFYVELARRAREHARGPEEAEWLDVLARDVDNVRAALEWAIAARRADVGLALADALEPLWVRRRYHPEGLRWLKQLLELPGEVDDGIRAGALALAGRLAVELGDVERAEPWYVAAAEAAERAEEPERSAWVQHGLGVVAWRRDDLDGARRHLLESARLFEQIGLYAPMAGRHTFLADLEMSVGDLDAADEHARQALDGYTRAGDRNGVAGTHHSIGEVALRRGDLPLALRGFQDCLMALDETDRLFTAAHALAGVAVVAASRERPREAGVLWGVVEHAEEDAGSPIHSRELYASALGDLSEDALSAGRAMPLAEAIELALSI